MTTATKRKPGRPRKINGARPPKPSEITPAEFWEGQEGDAYTERNRVHWPDRKPFWQHIADLTGAQSFLDVGCNAGWNMLALRSLNEGFVMSGVDLNETALGEAAQQGLDVYNMPAHEIASSELFGPGCADLVVTSGVLIHIPPDELKATMRAIIDASRQYVLCVEYFADTEQEIEYRGHAGKLWKRPFGKLYQELGLSVVEFGESAQGFTECSWMLLERGS